jgi:3-hydroxy-9,10-secoandrosta-1,3,5(10)-triene-9,17-dione monooxygenase
MAETATRIATGRTNFSSRVAPSAEILLERARSLVPFLREKSDEINASRRVTDEVWQRLVDAGLVELLRPLRFGGVAAPMELMLRIAQQLAVGDGSVGWVYAVLSSHDLFLSFFPAHVQEEVWSSACPTSASSYNPTGKASAAPGGLRLTGRWSFCSGIDFCGWAVVGAIVGMLPGEKPMPDFRYCLVHKSQYEVVDDWHVMGLCGSGSKSIVMNDVFVPDERIVTALQVVTNTTPGVGVHEAPIYRTPGFSVFVFAFPSVATGIARGAYEAMKSDMQGRAARHDPMFELGRPGVQVHLAEASAMIDVSELLLDRAMGETFRQAHQEGTVSTPLRIRNRRDTVYLVINARRAAEILMSMAGGRGILIGGRVQRALRDIYAVSMHPTLNWDVQSLSYGAVELGGQPTDPIL